MLLNILKYWHPKVALRYLPMVEEIRRTEVGGQMADAGGQKNRDTERYKNNILEIGSGAIGIAPYLNRQVVGVDKKFEGKACPLLKQVIADAVSLPFADKSFDFVVSSDVLEHIVPADRKRVVAEWLRVTKQELILGFPEGKLSEKQDRKLYEEFKKSDRDDSAKKFFEEHLEYGLPRIDDVIKWIKEELKDRNIKGEIRVIDNLNLAWRAFLMGGWMTNNLFVDLFFRKIMLLAIPILKMFNQAPAYRKIIFVSIFKN